MLLGCSKDKDMNNYSFVGKAQKGPYAIGSTVTINELNSKLEQTGKTYTATIDSDDGSFSISNMELSSNYCLLTASGFYFNEIYGAMSSSALTLQAVTDVKDNENVNVNVFTHICKDRIIQIVSKGKGFVEARQQAELELRAFLGISDQFDSDFEDCDISENQNFNAALLALSVMLQRKNISYSGLDGMTVELSQLLSRISNDFKLDGEISDQSIIDVLLSNIANQEMNDIRQKIESYYSGMGLQYDIPDFESYVELFQKKYSPVIYSEVVYPEFAIPDPIMAPDSELPNILATDDSIFDYGTAFSVAAIVPFGHTLKVRIQINTYSDYSFGGPNYGWQIVNEYPNGFSLISQRQNNLMTTIFSLYDMGDLETTATIEYYMDDEETPYLSKNVRWERDDNYDY